MKTKFTNLFHFIIICAQSSKTVIWRENQEPGNITKLIGGDYDTAVNGPPFTFEMAPDADPEIRSKFEIKGCYFKMIVCFVKKN